MPSVMPSGFLLSMLLSGPIMLPLTAIAYPEYHTTDELRKEITSMLRHQDLDFLLRPVETVEIEFLINPRNELVITDVKGDCGKACAYVKELLNFRKVNYKQPRQLMRYTVSIRLVR
jgi:hypothetical protein